MTTLGIAGGFLVVQKGPVVQPSRQVAAASTAHGGVLWNTCSTCSPAALAARVALSLHDCKYKPG